MSALTWIDRARFRIDDRRPTKRSSAGAWVEFDDEDESGTHPAHKFLPLLVVALIAALGVSAVRIDLIRTRYALASVMDAERALIEEQRNLIVRRRQLRDPVELAVRARTLGFRPISVVLSLPDPSPANHADISSRTAPPSVAAAPPGGWATGNWR
jgi:hypothetical protein